MVLGDLDSYVKENETRSPTYAIHKNKLQMDKRLTYKSQRCKCPRGEHWQDILRYSIYNIFTNMSPRERDIKNKWDFIKIKYFCMAKENISKMKREPTVWENIFVNDTSDKVLISKIHDSTPERQTNQLKNGQKT